MVATAMSSWLSSNHKRPNYFSIFRPQDHRLDTLGILAFETAKTMSRLVSLYKSLSDDEIRHLRNNVMKSRAILYLNSEDEGFLLALACAERMEDLDRAANAVARLGLKCSKSGLNRVDQVYRDLKLGYVDFENLNCGFKDMDKVVDKMERLIVSTGNLYSELQALSELEYSERRIDEWKRNANSGLSQHANFDLFEQKISGHRKQVRHLKDVSLWNKSFDKSVDMMARMVYYVYGRICYHFSPYTPDLPTSPRKMITTHRKRLTPYHRHNLRTLFEGSSQDRASRSGPIVPSYRAMPKAAMVRFLSRESRVFMSDDDEMTDFGASLFGDGCRKQSHNKVFQAAPPSTVGGSGLAMRYANVITSVERHMKSGTVIGEQARENLYNMLPASLRRFVKSKLKNARKELEECGGEMSLAEGWRDAVEGIMEWLAPIAHATLAWQSERNLEKQMFDARPTVLLMQTLHYSDLVKTEAAIAEVLVGLSCAFWHEDGRLADDLYS
ncbi:hypothetical protein Droror1_Dr00008656 [Drosera rotundifolia]